MKKEKKNEKITIKVDSAVAAYRILTNAKDKEQQGIKLGALDTQDIFKVIRAINALKPVATAFEDFQKDAQERLKPESWDDKIRRFSAPESTDGEKAEINREAVDYSAKVNECVSSELEKEKELDAYEHLGEEAFGKLVKANDHILDVRSIMLLQEVLC